MDPQGIKCKCGALMRETWDEKCVFVTLLCPACGKTRRMGYDRFRKKTSICETCRRSIINHPTCPGCGIFVGPGHTFQVRLYRGVLLCHLCIKSWEELEKDLHRKITREELERLWHPRPAVRKKAKRAYKRKKVEPTPSVVHNIRDGVRNFHPLEPALEKTMGELFPEVKKGLEEMREKRKDGKIK